MRARDLLGQIAQAAWQCADPGVQYDTIINDWHTCPESGRINASNPCSEYMHVDDSACNLASINLMKFRREDGSFDTEEFEHTVDTVFLAQEIVVGPSSYPTERIGDNARAFRQLGLGYANLGALLMSDGVPYDSDEGRNIAGAITALMTGRGYRKSAEIAAAVGTYDEYPPNRDAHNNVMRMHRDASYKLDDDGVKGELVAAAQRSWDDAVELGDEHGYRNAQATVLAPTGTISFLMDCDTTGIEPDFSLVKFKELVGGGQMTIVNRTVPMALDTLGYSETEIEQIEAYINDKGTIVGAPGLKDGDLPVFDVAVGERAISHMGHIKMMAAAQPFLSGAISKTVNLPQTATVDDIAEAYTEGWKHGLKALAIYRDGSKTAQALRTDAQDSDDEEAEAATAKPERRKMPQERESITHKFSIGGHEGYITAGKYEDGSVGEIFLTDIGKEGSTIKGMMNAFATAVSIGLQYGVPLETFVKKFSYMRFEPEGITKNPEIPFAKSMPDYIMRWVASRFIEDLDDLEDLGILTPEVRARKEAQLAIFTEDTAAPAHAEERNGNGNGNAERSGEAGRRGAHRHPAGGPGADLGRRPRPGLRPVRRHDAADRLLLHVLELRQQHRLRLRCSRASTSRWCGNSATSRRGSPEVKRSIGKTALVSASKPVLIAVDDDPAALARIRGELDRRYGQDYRVVCGNSPETAISRLEEMRAAGESVALVLADVWMAEQQGSEMLDRVRRLHPHAKRALLIDWGAWGHPRPPTRSCTRWPPGRIDYYVLKPARDADEQFHRIDRRVPARVGARELRGRP